MKIIVVTQGADVTVDDLGKVTFSDPSTTTLYDSLLQTNFFSLEEVRLSADLQTEITAGNLELQDEDGNPFESVISLVNSVESGTSNRLIINSLSDFPKVAGGKYTLADGKTYQITSLEIP